MVALAVGPKVETPEPIPPSNIRRFGVSDLQKHGGWILKRMQQAYPHETDRSLIGWLRNLCNDNGSLFLYQENGVCLFQITKNFTLDLKPMVIERFVFAKEGFANDVAAFYDEAVKWTKSMMPPPDQIVVEQMTDVPHELIKEKLGRLFTRTQTFARF